MYRHKGCVPGVRTCCYWKHNLHGREVSTIEERLTDTVEPKKEDISTPFGVWKGEVFAEPKRRSDNMRNDKVISSYETPTKLSFKNRVDGERKTLSRNVYVKI